MKKYIFLVLIVSFLVLPFLAKASILNGPLVQCGTKANPNPCTLCDIFKLVKTIINFISYGLFILAPIFIVVGGLMILLAGAKPSNVDTGKSIIKNALIGVIIALLAWTVINVMLSELVDQSKFPWPWNKIECTGGGVNENTDNTLKSGANCCCNSRGGDYNCRPDSYLDLTSCNAPSGCETYCKAFYYDSYDKSCCIGTKGKCGGSNGDCTGASCGADINFCGNATADCSLVNNWDSQIQSAIYGKSICSGINTVAFVKAIMAIESHGDIKQKSPAGAGGLMQLLPSTASQYKTQCGVSDNITLDWLTSSANAEKEICMAVEYMKALASQCGCSLRNIAAGYNGSGVLSGPQKGACEKSANCGPEASADGGNCIACSGEPYTLAWECLWSDNKHTQCDSAFQETRAYVPKVNYCYDKFQ